MIYKLVRKALFSTPPEFAHDLALNSLKLGKFTGATRLLCASHAEQPVAHMGLTFPNPLGIAAGLDKNGDYIDALGSLGFGFIEIGTVTPRPQAGNPKPRLFRIPEAQAVINRMGFNNKGVDHLVKQAAKRQYSGILGINIGKNKDTPNEQAADDYLYCLDMVYPHADYITINISSPNTAGLRDLQAADSLNHLLGSLNKQRNTLAKQHGKRVPLTVKIAPDINTETDIASIVEAMTEHQIDGLIATNTTIDHSSVENLPHGDETGGLSGEPLKPLANQVLSAFHQALPDSVCLIGVGGIMDGNDALEKKQRGADLLQVYTGFLYQGPDLVSDCLTKLSNEAA